MLDLQSEIRTEIDSFNLERARELLKEPLKNPTPEILHLAAMAAINDQQRISFLQKALQLDPSDGYALAELARLQGQGTPTARPLPMYIPVPPQFQVPLQLQPKQRTPWIWIGLILLVVTAGTVIGASLLLNQKMPVAAADLPKTSLTPKNTVVVPTATPAGPTIIAKAFQCLPEVTSDQDTTFRAEACINKSDQRPNQGATVKVYGRLIVNGKVVDNYLMDTYWDFLFLPDELLDSPKYDSQTPKGITVAAYNLGAFTTPDYPVQVYVTFEYNGVQHKIATTNTTFTPLSR